MRPIHQVLVAVAVVAGAAASAFAIQGSYCQLTDAQTAALTHKFTTQGVGGGVSSYECEDGVVAFQEDVSCFTNVRIAKPVAVNQTATQVYMLLPVRKYTNTRCYANVNTANRKLNETVKTELLGTVQDVVVQLAQVERLAAESYDGRRPFRPIDGNVTLSKVVGVANARVYDEFTTYDGTIVVKYFGTVSSESRGTRKVRGKVGLKFRRAPRSEP